VKRKMSQIQIYIKSPRPLNKKFIETINLKFKNVHCGDVSEYKVIEEKRNDVIERYAKLINEKYRCTIIATGGIIKLEFSNVVEFLHKVLELDDVPVTLARMFRIAVDMLIGNGVEVSLPIVDKILSKFAIQNDCEILSIPRKLINRYHIVCNDGTEKTYIPVEEVTDIITWPAPYRINWKSRNIMASSVVKLYYHALQYSIKQMFNQQR